MKALPMNGASPTILLGHGARTLHGCFTAGLHLCLRFHHIVLGSAISPLMELAATTAGLVK
jgi:hypothetical protein